MNIWSYNRIHTFGLSDVNIWRTKPLRWFASRVAELDTWLWRKAWGRKS